MRVYFDICSLNRPFDDRTQLRVAWEAEAVLQLLVLFEVKLWTLLSSAVLMFEADRNPYPQRQAFVREIQASAEEFAPLNSEIEQRSEELQQNGFQALDALHLAPAEWLKADYFCTCDDRLLSKAKLYVKSPLRVLSPLELVQEVG
jgi:predicted nucleic acid-binding protein